MSDSEKKLTESARNALELARQQAELLGQTYIGTEHAILGILLEGKSAASAAIRRQGVTAEQYSAIIQRHIGRGIRSRLSFSELSSNMQNILSELLRYEKLPVGTKQLLLRILQCPGSAGCRYLLEAGCGPEALQECLNNLHSEEHSPKNQRKVREREGVLRKYTTNLTELAREHKLDPVIGREEETEQLLRVLSRRSKNNPCLVGEAGVGKTAIVEGLAQRIVSGNVPERLMNKQILTLDLCALLAGSKFRGEFEERIQQCLAELLAKGDSILFIDEIHMLAEAGSAEGATSAANLLKPQLARGDLQVIGATTWSEFKRFIEKDGALARRFQKIVVEEPSPEKAVEMLCGLMPRYELHHGVKIPKSTVEAAVSLSQRYLNERQLPDKALDLLDETAAQCAQEYRQEFRRRKQQMENQLAVLDEEKRSSLRSDDLFAAAEISLQEDALRRELQQLRPLSSQNIIVTSEAVAKLIARMTGIAAESITEQESEKLLRMEAALGEQVVGQEQAVKAVSEAIRCSRAGLNDPHRPMASFLFLGPSGVGKTQLCKVLAKELFGSEEAMIRLDMSEFAQEHMAARLIGAPPGYVGYQEGGRLTEAVRKKPYSLILFDELEKAHPRVCDLLLQILEDGQLEDGEGKRISFRSCVIVMTSNIGAEHFRKGSGIGFGGQSDNVSHELAAAKSRDELKKQFRPEFINRIDEILVFRWLGQEALQSICRQLLNELSQRLKQQNLTLQVSENAVDQLCKEGYEPQLGARPLRRCIRRRIEQPLSAELLSGNYRAGDSIFCDFSDDTFCFSVAEKSVPDETEQGKTQIAFTC